MKSKRKNIGWSKTMSAKNGDSNKIDSDTAGDQKNKQADKRFSDNVGPGGRPLNRDRRTIGRDRRMNNSQDYRGNPRRNTVDRRGDSDEPRDED
jgi:hypothetical protein